MFWLVSFMLSFDICCVFFFFKQKTAYEMRISDWSSDVCSSDLGLGPALAGYRSGLWFEYLRLIGELEPEWVIIENVSALRTRGLVVILHGLASLWSESEWQCILASSFGGPHPRDGPWAGSGQRRVGEEWSRRGRSGATTHT